MSFEEHSEAGCAVALDVSPTLAASAARPSDERWRRLPMFLHLRAVKVR